MRAKGGAVTPCAEVLKRMNCGSSEIEQYPALQKTIMTFFFFKRWLSTPHTVHFENQSDSASKLLPSNKWHTFKKKTTKIIQQSKRQGQMSSRRIQPAEKYPVERYPRYPNPRPWGDSFGKI